MFSTSGLTGFPGLSRKNERRKKARREEEGSCCCFLSPSPSLTTACNTPFSWKTAAHWLAPQDLLSLFSYTPRDHLSRGGTTHNELGLPASITRKMHHSCAHRLILWRKAFSRLRFLFPEDTSLCRVDKTSTMTQLIHLTAFFVSCLLLSHFL